MTPEQPLSVLVSTQALGLRELRYHLNLGVHNDHMKSPLKPRSGLGKDEEGHGNLKF